MEANIENVFKRGCLIQNSCSVWGGKVKLPQSAINVDADPDFIRASKFLIDKDCLKPIEKVRNEAKQYIYGKTIPFPISGIMFIPKDLISIVDAKLKEYQSEFDLAVEEFAQNYEIFINNARERLGSLFNISEYPRDIRKYFGFSWRFLTMDTPGQIGLLPAEVYEREKQKFVQTINAFQENAVATLRTSFAEMIDHVVERLSGEKKVFRDTLIGNVREFIEDFKALNITDDAAMTELTNRCRFILDGISPQDLRDDEGLRTHVVRKITEVQKDLDGMMVDRPTRKLRRVEDVAA